jgi:hypothetical protein
MGHNVAHKVMEIIMTANAVVRARIDEHIKEEASAVLASMGLTVSDAFLIGVLGVNRPNFRPNIFHLKNKLGCNLTNYKWYSFIGLMECMANS